MEAEGVDDPMLGKRKEPEEEWKEETQDEEHDEAVEESPDGKKQDPSESTDTDSAAGGSEKKCMHFDAGVAADGSAQTPAKKQRMKAKTPQQPVDTGAQEYIPDEKEQYGNFIVQVEDDWREVNGFRVFEYKGTATEIPEEGKTQFTKLREWYCSKDVEPKGGFKPGHQVEVIHMVMSGNYTRKFIEIVGEQERVAEAYARLSSDYTVQAGHGASDVVEAVAVAVHEEGGQVSEEQKMESDTAEGQGELMAEHHQDHGVEHHHQGMDHQAVEHHQVAEHQVAEGHATEVTADQAAAEQAAAEQAAAEQAAAEQAAADQAGMAEAMHAHMGGVDMAAAHQQMQHQLVYAPHMSQYMPHMHPEAIQAMQMQGLQLPPGMMIPGMSGMTPAVGRGRGRRGQKAKSPGDPSEVDKAPKPQTAYMVFVNANRDQILADFPGISIPDLGKKCGEIWRSLSPEEKQAYKAAACDPAAAAAIAAAAAANRPEGAPPALPPGARMKRPRPQLPPGSPKPPQTAYMVFVNANRDRLLAEYPGISIPDLGKKCGEVWRTMDPEAKKVYQDIAAAQKERFAHEQRERLANANNGQGGDLGAMAAAAVAAAAAMDAAVAAGLGGGGYVQGAGPLGGYVTPAYYASPGMMSGAVGVVSVGADGRLMISVPASGPNGGHAGGGAGAGAPESPQAHGGEQHGGEQHMPQGGNEAGGAGREAGGDAVAVGDHGAGGEAPCAPPAPSFAGSHEGGDQAAAAGGGGASSNGGGGAHGEGYHAGGEQEGGAAGGMAGVEEEEGGVTAGDSGFSDMADMGI